MKMMHRCRQRGPGHLELARKTQLRTARPGIQADNRKLTGCCHSACLDEPVPEVKLHARRGAWDPADDSGDLVVRMIYEFVSLLRGSVVIIKWMIAAGLKKGYEN